MDFSYYIFAFFIFILMVFLIILIKKVKSTDSKESIAIKEKEEKLFKLYQNLEEMILDTEELIDEAKRNIAEDRKTIHSMLDRADNFYSRENIGKKLTVSGKDMKPKVVEIITKAEQVNNIGDYDRKQQVMILKKEGRNTEEISKELSISRGEVELIIGLNK